MEEWKVVPNTNGKIEVSNEGRIRSLLRGNPYILKQSIDSKGYCRIRITINRQKLCFKTHRIVAQAFIPNPQNLPQVNHIDGNKQNNNISNLEWISNKDNCHHAIDHGLWKTVYEGSLRENNSRKKAVIATKDGKVMEFESVSDAEKYLESRHISDALKGKRQHVKGWSLSYREEVMPCQHLH